MSTSPQPGSTLLFDLPMDESLLDLVDDDFASFLDDILDEDPPSPSHQGGAPTNATTTTTTTTSPADLTASALIMSMDDDSAPVAIATHVGGEDDDMAATPAPIVPLNMNVPPAKYAVDYLDPSTIPPQVHPGTVRAENTLAGLEFTTVFQKKYFRFDNKMLQCFPKCEKFQDVREARMLGLDHGYNDVVRRAGGAWCSGVVSLTLTVAPNTNPGLLHVRSRFVMATPEAGMMPGDFPQFLKVGQTLRDLPASPHIMGGTVVVLTYRGAPVLDNVGRMALAVHFQPGPNGWTHDMELPRHRRNVSQQGARVTIPLFALETMVFLQGPTGYTVLARATSSLFEVSSVRTLLREALLFRQSVAAAQAVGGAVPQAKKTKVVNRKFQRVGAKDSAAAVLHSMSEDPTTTQPTPASPPAAAAPPKKRDSLLSRFLRLSVR